MKMEHGLGHRGNWCIAWLLLCLSFAANILDDVVNGFLDGYNPTILTLYGHFSWFPRIDLRFREWLMGVVVADAYLLFLTPWAFRNSRFLPTALAYLFSTLMLLKGCGGILASVRGRTVGSVHFAGMAPGTYSSPLLLAGSAYLLLRLRSSA